MKTNKTDLAQLARSAGLNPYDDHAGVYNVPAFVRNQTNGKTCYYDESTMRYFGCRISKAYTEGGMIIATICRQDINSNGRKGYVVAIHDLTGHCVYRTELESAAATLRTAEKEFWRVINGLDTRQILREAVMRERDTALRAVRDMRKALRKLPARRVKAEG